RRALAPTAVPLRMFCGFLIHPCFEASLMRVQARALPSLTARSTACGLLRYRADGLDPVRLAPGERRVAGRVQVAAAVAAEPERPQQPWAPAKHSPGARRPDADHLFPVFGVGDDGGFLGEGVEEGEAVGGDRADPAGRLVPVRVALALEPLVAV